MNHAILLSALLVAASAGCAGLSEQGQRTTAQLRVGTQVVYALGFDSEMGPIHGNASFVFRAPEDRSLPDGRTERVLPVETTVRHDDGTVTRLAEISLRDGTLFAVGDLRLSGEGSEQYTARTHRWGGAPEGGFDLERCLVGVALPISLAIVRGADHQDLGAFASWDGTAGPLSSTDGTSAGNVQVDRVAAGWPGALTWQKGQRACTLTLGELTSSDGEIVEWAAGAPEGALRMKANDRFAGRIPPTGTLPIGLDLTAADDAVASHPTGRVFFASHPDVWLAKAEYHGPAAAALGERPGTWHLVYASPSGAKWFEVSRGPAGTPLVQDRPDPSGPFAAIDRTQEVVAASSVLASFPDVPPESIAAIGWYTAASAEELQTDDEQVWQFRWSTDGGSLENVVFAATSGRQLARVVLPR